MTVKTVKTAKTLCGLTGAQRGELLANLALEQQAYDSLQTAYHLDGAPISRPGDQNILLAMRDSEYAQLALQAQLDDDDVSKGW